MCDLIGKFHNYKVLIQVAVKNIFVVELPKLLVEFNYALLICSTSKGSVELYMPLRTNLEKVTAFDYSAITIQLPEFSGSSVNMKENKLIISDIRYLATWLFKFDISNE